MSSPFDALVTADRRDVLETRAHLRRRIKRYREVKAQNVPASIKNQFLKLVIKMLADYRMAQNALLSSKELVRMAEDIAQRAMIERRQIGENGTSLIWDKEKRHSRLIQKAVNIDICSQFDLVLIPHTSFPADEPSPAKWRGYAGFSRIIKHRMLGFWRGPIHVPGKSAVPYEWRHDCASAGALVLFAGQWQVLDTPHLQTVEEFSGTQASWNTFEIWLTARRYTNEPRVVQVLAVERTLLRCRREWEEAQEGPGEGL